VALLLIGPHPQTIYLSVLAYGRKQEKLSWSSVRGVFLGEATVDYGVDQHRLQNVGHWGVVI